MRKFMDDTNPFVSGFRPPTTRMAPNHAPTLNLSCPFGILIQFPFRENEDVPGPCSQIQEPAPSLAAASASWGIEINMRGIMFSIFV
jgi:hypothetical protein